MTPCVPSFPEGWCGLDTLDGAPLVSSWGREGGSCWGRRGLELPVGILLVPMLCWTWALVQLLLHSARAVTALHVEEAHAWSVVHGTGAGGEHVRSLGLVHVAPWIFPSR